MNDLVRIFGSPAGRGPAGRFFNLQPSTMDRPDFFSISRLSQIRTLLGRLAVIPEHEIGWLLNLAVLGQALILALIVLILPLGAGRKALRQHSVSGGFVLTKVFLYFAALGFGFFFIELALVKKLSFFLESSTLAFAAVLAGVLVFSGLGSWWASRLQPRRRRGLAWAVVIIAASLLFLVFGLDPLMRACIGLPLAVRILISALIMAPLSFALGRPFALGTSSLGGYADSLIPWAWAINGAFSVLATPLANILSVTSGWNVVIVLALVLYASTLLSFPARRADASAGGGAAA